MNKSATTVPIDFIKNLLGGLSLSLEQRARYMQQIGISMDLLDEGSARVTTDQFAGLYRLLAREIDDETPGMFSRPLRGGTLKFLCLSMLESANLIAALYRFTQFFRLILDDLEFELENKENLVRIALIPKTSEVSQNYFAQEMMLKLVHGIASWLAGRKIPLARIDFTYSRPAHVSEYVFLYPGPAYFDQALTALYFEGSQLQTPIRQDKHSLSEFLAHAPADWIFVSFAERIVSHRVREHLEKRLDQTTNIEEVAKALHFSLRTLSRRLGEEGTSFQAIKDELRRDVAIQRLTKTRLPVAVIGNQIGFDDPTTFHRAFKKWTGSSPGVYRRRTK
uniref:Transcriptional regulator, AraC family n=1 Tax=Dechloromonas aromatica (strain RCB) TaxID=159087 RepID=Q47DI4_DECAR